MSTIPEIVPFSETNSQTAQEGLGVGAQVIAKSEMPKTGHSGESSQPGQEGLRVGQDVRKSTMPEVGQSDGETSQPVVSGSTSEMRLDEMLTAGIEPVSEKKSVEVKLSEASDSAWFDAIEKKDCKLLLALFRSDRSLWVQTGLTGRSVLHVAVMQGCSELVRELHDYRGDLVPGGKNWQTPVEFLWENARDGRLKNASAQDLWLVMEGPCDRQSLLGRSRNDYILSHTTCRMLVDSEILSLRGEISYIAREKDFEMDENDVDFNFENVERKELYLHMACIRLRNFHNEGILLSPGCSQILDFISAVLERLPQNLLQKLFNQKDAKGRTILQVLVTVGHHSLSHYFREMLENLPGACVNTLDKAGRTVLHWAVAHGITWAVHVLLKSGKASLDITFETQYIRRITAFHLILLYDLNLPPSDVSPDFQIMGDEPPYWPSLKDELKTDRCVQPNFDLQFYSNVRSEYVADTPVISAIFMRRNKFVKDIMKILENQELDIPKNDRLVALAAFSGNVEILQLFLQKQDVDKLNVCDHYGAPPLHLAVKAQTITRSPDYGYEWGRTCWPDFRNFDDWLHCNDFISIKLLEKKLREQDLEEDSAIAGAPNINRNQYSGRQACANLLLQAGA